MLKLTEEQVKAKPYQQLLGSIYDQNRESMMANPLKKKFLQSIDRVTQAQSLTERNLRDSDGRMDPSKLNTFLQDVGSEMGIDRFIVEDTVNDLALEEYQDLVRETQEAAYDGTGLNMDNRRYEWFAEGVQAVYGVPFDYKQSARYFEDDVRQQELDGVVFGPEDEYMGDYVADPFLSPIPGDISVDMTDMPERFHDNPKEAAFYQLLDNMRLYDKETVLESPIADAFKDAVESHSLATNTRNESLRDGNGVIEYDKFKAFIQGVGADLELDPNLVEFTFDELDFQQSLREENPDISSEWFVESFEDVYDQPFDHNVPDYGSFDNRTSYDVIDDKKLNGVALNQEIVASPGSSYDTMRNFVNDIKESREPSDVTLKDAFRSSTFEMVDNWAADKADLINDKALFRDWMAKNITGASDRAESNDEHKLGLADAYAIMQESFGSDIAPEAIESFTDGFQNVYQSPIDIDQFTFDDEQAMAREREPAVQQPIQQRKAAVVQDVEPEVEDDGFEL